MAEFRSFIDTPFGNSVEAQDYCRLTDNAWKELRALGMIRPLPKTRDTYDKGHLDSLPERLAAHISAAAAAEKAPRRRGRNRPQAAGPYTPGMTTTERLRQIREET